MNPGGHNDRFGILFLFHLIVFWHKSYFFLIAVMCVRTGMYFAEHLYKQLKNRLYTGAFYNEKKRQIKIINLLKTGIFSVNYWMREILSVNRNIKIRSFWNYLEWQTDRCDAVKNNIICDFPHYKEVGKCTIRRNCEMTIVYPLKNIFTVS